MTAVDGLNWKGDLQNFMALPQIRTGNFKCRVSQMIAEYVAAGKSVGRYIACPEQGGFKLLQAGYRKVVIVCEQ